MIASPRRNHLYGGRKIRTLIVIGEANREALAIEATHAIPSVRVVRVLGELVAVHRALWPDNVPEPMPYALAQVVRGALHHTPPHAGRQARQNPFIERFNGSYRREVLDTYVFASLDEVIRVSDDWRHGYNTPWMHDSVDQPRPRIHLSRDITPPDVQS